MATRGNMEDDPIIQGYLESAGVEDAKTGAGDEANTESQQNDGSSSQQQQQQSDDKSGQQTSLQDSGSGKPNGDQKQSDPKAQAQGADPTKVKEVAKAGDLTLDDGTIVRSGKERRFYENMRIARDQASSWENKAKTHEQTIAQLQTQVQTHQQSLNAIGAANPQEVSDSLRLMKDLRSNPTGTLQTLLAELAASGVDLSSIVTGLDMKAMSAMLDQRIPQQQQQQQQADPVKEAENEARDFATAHPDALLHQDIIVSLAKNNPNMKLEQLYWELRKSVADNGYDWSQPLGPQHAARNPQSGQQQQRKPMPNGSGGTGFQDAGEVMKNKVGSDDDSIDAIVRSAMKETGYRQ
jgi:hypothetical protein